MYTLSGNTLHVSYHLYVCHTKKFRYGVRAAPKFGNHESLFSYHKEKNYKDHHIQRNTCILLSLNIVSFLENISHLHGRLSPGAQQKNVQEISSGSARESKTGGDGVSV